MPDYPYVYTSDPLRQVAPGGTRVRFLRRRPRKGEEEESGTSPEGGKDRGDPGWRSLLETAVQELNDSFRDAKVPFSCTLEEDEDGFTLQVRPWGDGGDPGVEEELLEPADLPQWLARLRSRLGILVDRTA
jgi:hypothetical protein